MDDYKVCCPHGSVSRYTIYLLNDARVRNDLPKPDGVTSEARNDASRLYGPKPVRLRMARFTPFDEGYFADTTVTNGTAGGASLRELKTISVVIDRLFAHSSPSKQHLRRCVPKLLNHPEWRNICHHPGGISFGIWYKTEVSF